MLRRTPAAAGATQERNEERADEKRWAALAVGVLLAGGAAAQQGQVNDLLEADWCNLIQTVYAKTTGVKVNMSLKGWGGSGAADRRARQSEDRRLVAPVTRTCRPPSRT